MTSGLYDRGSENSENWAGHLDRHCVNLASPQRRQQVLKLCLALWADMSDSLPVLHCPWPNGSGGPAVLESLYYDVTIFCICWGKFKAAGPVTHNNISPFILAFLGKKHEKVYHIPHWCNPVRCSSSAVSGYILISPWMTVLITYNFPLSR